MIDATVSLVGLPFYSMSRYNGTTYAELKTRGVEFKREIGEEEWGWYVHFADPEGNRLQLYQPRPGH